MTPRFYDSRSETSGPAGSPLAPGAMSARAEREAQFRRRRTIASLGAFGLLALVIALISGGGSPSARHSSSAQAGKGGARPPLRPISATAPASVTVAQTAAINRVSGYTTTITGGGSRRRDVALTFDDGPSTYTPQLLAVLARLHVPATFFQIGRAAHMYPDLGRTEISDGFPIGDHTLTHPFLGHLSPGDQKTEIVSAANEIRSYGAPQPRLFRPPYGSYDAVTEKLLRSQHMLSVLWSVDTRDFSQPGVSQIVFTALSGAKPGAIILMHDGGGPRSETIAAIPRIVDGLRRRGFRLVTVPQMMLENPPPPNQTKPGSLAGPG